MHDHIRSMYNHIHMYTHIYICIYTYIHMKESHLTRNHEGRRVLFELPDDRSIARSLDRSIVRSLVRSTARSLGRSVARTLDRSITRSLGLLGRSVARSLSRLVARSLGCSVARCPIACSIPFTSINSHINMYKRA